MAMYRIKERHIEDQEYDESNYWMEMRPSQRLSADLEEYARLNELADDDGAAPLKNRNPWRRSKLIWLLAALAVLSFVFWSFRDYIFGEKMDFSLIAHSNRLAQEESLAALKEAVVSIECAGRSGTGFNISPDGLIVTNAHVVSGGGYVTLFFPTGEQRVYITNDVMEIEGVDLALVDIDGENLPSVEMGDYIPETDQKVIFIGNPLGYDWTISEGTVTGTTYVDDTQVICINGPVHPGSSGSPVFDGESRVIGVIFAKLTQEDDKGLAIPISKLTDHISER